MDPTLLELLRCPVTHQPLRLTSAAAAVELGLEERPILLREDGLVYFEFEEHGFPLLLPGSGTPVPGRTAGS